jgi:phosphoglycolate phosphatase
VTLILFDIDGTLVLTGGAGGRAMTAAFEEIFSITDAFKGMPMAGRTDAWILADAAAIHGIAPESPDLARFPEVYLAHLVREIHQPAPPNSVKGVMPGVSHLLEALSVMSSNSGDVLLALLTGNYEAAAQVKLEYFDLWRYFPCGAFGDAAPDRNGLLPKALRRVAELSVLGVRPSDVIVIGDTPLDIACAASGGARSIGVATGNFTVDQLCTAGADATFKDLSETSDVLRAIARLGNRSDLGVC